jgi:hypothetical protein
MAFKQRLGKVFLCVVLGFAAFGGAYMRPDEIEDLMVAMNRSKIAHTLPENMDNGDSLLRELGLSLPDTEGGEDAVEDVVGSGGAGDGVDRP